MVGMKLLINKNGRTDVAQNVTNKNTFLALSKFFLMEKDVELFACIYNLAMFS